MVVENSYKLRTTQKSQIIFSKSPVSTHSPRAADLKKSKKKHAKKSKQRRSTSNARGYKSICFWCGKRCKNLQSLRVHLRDCDKYKEYKLDPEGYRALHAKEMQENYDRQSKQTERFNPDKAQYREYYDNHNRAWRAELRSR